MCIHVDGDIEFSIVNPGHYRAETIYVPYENRAVPTSISRITYVAEY